jgi:hypothetical protein
MDRIPARKMTVTLVTSAQVRETLHRNLIPTQAPTKTLQMYPEEQEPVAVGNKINSSQIEPQVTSTNSTLSQPIAVQAPAKSWERSKVISRHLETTQ